ncbi:uncharacterized protein ppp1r3ab [Hippoglossus hippoglossus]|uniref:uncharacterized protein ppp1r3ab n=1 Tax=Hippoglossus hippoglossus TaxID=8267 RepID=UPI00148CD302|nr:uncharacterized protein ppp1r3ab [Hippoglossus hippoglossus]
MEFVGQPRLSGTCNLLGVPGPSSLDEDSDEGEDVICIRPKSSPLPRRKSSSTDEEWEPEPPLSGSRRVSFADSKGLSLVQVKEFDTWDVPKLPGYGSPEGEGTEAEEYFLSPHTFSLPLSTEELFVKVRDQRLELETIELLHNKTTILKGVIRVLNISFSKTVYVRTTLDAWSSYFDLLAEFVPCSNDSLMDCFSFKLTLVPPFGEQGARVEFCLRYETPVGTFWANNNNRNYVLFCHQRVKDKPQRDNVNKKSCLKTVSQNFFAENISTTDASPEESTSAISVVSKYAEEATTMKAKQISDGEDGQKTKNENRRISSRRSGRKAARIARAQREKGGSDTEREETLPEAKQAACEEKQVEKHSDVPSLSEGGNRSELSQVVSEALETCSKSLLDVLHDTSLGDDSRSNSEPEKPESKHLTDSATLTGGGSATDTSDKPLHSHDESAPAKSVCRAEGETQEQHTSYESANNSVVNSVTSVVTSDGLVSQNTNFTFGTVVAPLYQQMFGRAGCESENLGEWGNPIQATLSIGESTHSYPHTEGKESCGTLLTDLRNNADTSQGNVINTQESHQENLDAISNNPPNEEEQTGLYETAGDIQDSIENLLHPGEVVQGCTNASDFPKTLSGAEVNILHTDLLSTQVPTESLHQQGDAQEDSLSCDFQNQKSKEEAAQAQPPENTSSQTISKRDTTEADDVTASVENLLLPLQPDGDETVQQTSKGGEDDIEDCKHTPVSTTKASPEVDNLVEPDEDLTPNTVHHSAARQTENIYMSNGEDAEGNYSSTPGTSQETQTETQTETRNGEEQNKLTNNRYEDEKEHSGEAEVNDEEDESMTQATVRDNHTCGNDTFVESKEEESLKDEPMSAAILREDLADTTEENNWEMMVEEDEKNILADQEENKATFLKADTETEQGGRSEDTGIETELEDRNSAEREKGLAEELSDAGENGTEAKEAEGLEDKESDGEEIWKVGELENVQAKNTEKKEAEEEHRDGDIEMEKGEEQEETELEKEQHFAEMQEVSNGRNGVREEEEIEGEEEMQTDLNNGDDDGVVWDDQIKPREENAEEENPNYEVEIALDGAGDSEVVDPDSESMTAEDGEDEVTCFEEMLDVTQVKEEGLSAQMNRVQACNKDREEGSAHIPAEIYFYKEEDFQGTENDTNNRSEAERLSSAMEGDSCILTDEPEGDQTGHDSAESDSDDEVELYMHCLRAVHTGAQANKDKNKDKNKDTGFSMGKRPSVNRGKLLSTPMPSITESLDEDPHLSCHQDNHEDTDAADVQPAAAAPSLLGGQETVNTNVSWWKETFSCSNLSRTLLCITLLVFFFVVAYHYDFFACFGLYLISVVWLCFQGERKPAKNNNRIG